MAGLLERRGHHVVGQAADTPELTALVDAPLQKSGHAFSHQRGLIRDDNL